MQTATASPTLAAARSARGPAASAGARAPGDHRRRRCAQGGRWEEVHGRGLAVRVRHVPARSPPRGRPHRRLSRAPRGCLAEDHAEVANVTTGTAAGHPATARPQPRRPGPRHRAAGAGRARSRAGPRRRASLVEGLVAGSSKARVESGHVPAEEGRDPRPSGKRQHDAAGAGNESRDRYRAVEVSREHGAEAPGLAAYLAAS